MHYDYDGFVLKALEKKDRQRNISCLERVGESPNIRLEVAHRPLRVRGRSVHRPEFPWADIWSRIDIVHRIPRPCPWRL